MPNNTEPISQYIDPDWYEDFKNFESGKLSGPISPIKYIRPIASRQIDPDPSSDELQVILARDRGVDLYRKEIEKALQDNPNVIQNRALQAQKREEFFNKSMMSSLFPQEITYTTDVNRLKDRMVLVLRAPDAKSNPGFNRNNRDQKLFFSTLDYIKKSSVVQGAAAVGEAAGEMIRENIPGGESLGTIFGNVIDETKNFINTKLLTSGAVAEGIKKFERLNENFYNQGSSGDKFKIIYLPMPQGQLIDSHSHSIQGVAMNPLVPIVGAGLSMANAIFGGKQTGDKGDGNRGFQSGAAVGNYALNALQLAARKAINPAQETLYQSPVPRQWQFTFVYIPTNKDEADSFLNIVEILKQHSYPTIDADAVLYNFPGTVDFYFVTNSTEIDSTKSSLDSPNINEKLPRSLFPCFIKSVQISYINETNTFTHFWDGNPTSINLTLDIVESKLLSRESLDPSINILETSTRINSRESTSEEYSNTPPNAIA